MELPLSKGSKMPTVECRVSRIAAPIGSSILFGQKRRKIVASLAREPCRSFIFGPHAHRANTLQRESRRCRGFQATATAAATAAAYGGPQLRRRLRRSRRRRVGLIKVDPLVAVDAVAAVRACISCVCGHFARGSHFLHLSCTYPDPRLHRRRRVVVGSSSRRRRLVVAASSSRLSSPRRCPCVLAGVLTTLITPGPHTHSRSSCARRRRHLSPYPASSSWVGKEEEQSGPRGCSDGEDTRGLQGASARLQRL